MPASSKKRKKRKKRRPPRERKWLRHVPRVLAGLAVLSLAYCIYDCQRRGRVTGFGREDHLEMFLRQLSHPDPAMSAAAARELGEARYRKAIEPLREKLRGAPPQVLAAACVALGKMGDQKAADPALELLEHRELVVVRAAARCLGELGCKRAVEPLTRLLAIRDAATRLAAIEALKKIGDPAALRDLEKRRDQLAQGFDTGLAEEDRARVRQALDEAIQALKAPPKGE